MTDPLNPDKSDPDKTSNGKDSLAEMPRKEYARNPATPSITRERETSRKIDRMLDAVYGESWSQNLLLLVLTAGPVTFIGLQAGYYVG